MAFGADRSRHGRAHYARAGVQTSRASSPPAVPGGLRFNTQTHPLKTETDRFETVAHRLKTETDRFETAAHRLKTETPVSHGRRSLRSRCAVDIKQPLSISRLETRISREVSASADDADRRRFRTLICVSSASSADKQEKRAMRRRRGRSGVAPNCQRKLRVAVPFENHRRARTPVGCRQECLHYVFRRSGHPRAFTSANVISELA